MLGPAAEAGLPARVVPLIAAIATATNAARSRGVKRLLAGVLRISLPFQEVAARRVGEAARATGRGAVFA
jgi:hypothetical protein